MSPLEWLRRRPRSLSPEHQARFLEACEAVDAGIRGARLAPAQVAKPTTPPREIPWANGVRTAGACPHDVIYSECSCDRRERSKR